jgi:endonuclease YncB( thermonuclease family)
MAKDQYQSLLGSVVQLHVDGQSVVVKSKKKKKKKVRGGGVDPPK